jgi:hypothetical protein
MALSLRQWFQPRISNPLIAANEAAAALETSPEQAAAAAVTKEQVTMRVLWDRSVPQANGEEQPCDWDD